MLDCTLPGKLSWYSQAHSRPRSQVQSQLHSMTHFQPAWQPSQVGSQDTLKYTTEYVHKYFPEYALKDTSNCTQWHTPSLLGWMLLCKVSRHSQAHSRPWSQVHSPDARPSKSYLAIPSHVCSWVLDPETCWVAGTRHWDTGGGRLRPKSWHWSIWYSEPHFQRGHRDGISRCLMVIVFTIAASNSARMVDICILGRPDLRLRFSSGICCQISIDCGCMCAHSFWCWWWWWP